MAFIQQTGEGFLLRSEQLPAISIRIHPQLTYVGNSSFVLYGVARVEQHHFVAADHGRRVERLLWFQFEGYLENNDYRYQYSGMQAITLGGLPFLHDAGTMNIDSDYAERPTSDSAHVVDYLKEKGYTLEGDTMFKRLVWLDPDLRNEMMIIYAEDLRRTGLRISDLSKDGRSGGQWISLSEGLHERALSSFTVEAD